MVQVERLLCWKADPSKSFIENTRSMEKDGSASIGEKSSKDLFLLLRQKKAVEQREQHSLLQNRLPMNVLTI